MTNPNQMFTDEQVRDIKMNLVAGVGLVALARRFNCSTETIGRMKRGLTYRHVKVLGEEKLRPEVTIVAPTKEDLAVRSGISDEEAERSEREFMAALAKAKAAQGVVREVDEASAEILKRFGAI